MKVLGWLRRKLLNRSHKQSDDCSYIRSLGGQCVNTDRGQHLHWCPKCQSLVVQRGGGLACEKGCIYIHMYVVVRGERPTADNGFNPVVVRQCPSCHGEGFHYAVGANGGTWIASDCELCHGAGTVTGPTYDETTPVVVAVAPDGWAHCPRCGFRFKPSDPNTMLGYRHKRCGQRIEFNYLGTQA